MTRLRIVAFALVATLAVGCFAAPAPLPDPDPNQLEITEIIAPAGIAQETLDSLNLGEPNAEQSERAKRTIGILRQLFPTLSQATSAVNADENLLSGAESQQSEVRVQFNENDNKDAEESKDDQSVDQESAASGGNNGAIDDLSLDDADASDENRNKRFLSFGGGGGDGHSGGSGGGSGNFLFDIIRLVAGSGGTEASDEATASPDDVAKGDGYTEGIPGPVTRLFIIANRGISNLIQDLILRIAQTSERIVNFKARLITSII